ncbi:YqaJ viral recombinase family protein [Actinotalea sp. M2MS4P-6]|uniref:YqaJ viral recombinase family nuclease n=1 Tax=Actinotalea sp. M2MS4P-6 TaxID=2983762 RepID=UPI0021E359BB|nr:YqaJ viral recombinase family protein [Actinotalea sp. M2MS4P-6]MCV2395959.1 YqaJ viral recombinase family protein [Actinotalea sp. M2MS4P-6]
MTTTAVRPGTWACPDATLVLPADAPREKWLAARRAGIGGSDASTVAGVNRWGSRYELWLDKTGRLPEQPETPAMRMGNLLEPLIAQLFTEETSIATQRKGLMRSRARTWQQVSVDRLTDDHGLLECKATNWRLAEEWDDGQVADHAEIQVQHALAVTGRSHAWVAVLIDGRDFRFERVERDERLIEVLTDMEDRFWRDHVLADLAPAMEANALDVVKDLYATVVLDARQAEAPDVVRDALARRESAMKAIKTAEVMKAIAEAELIEAVGDAEALLDGERTLLTRKANGTFAAARFAAAHPDVAAQYMTKAALDLDRLKDERPDLYAQYRARVLRPTKEK